MIPIQVKIISYDEMKNTCTAELQNGNKVEIDPYVGCAIALSDDDYRAGKGADIVGSSYVLTSYTVYPYGVVPHESGMVKVS